jgi:hypothetical protein
MLCFLSSRTVLACGPFSPISSTRVTSVPTAVNKPENDDSSITEPIELESA